MCPSLIEIGSKTAEKNSAQTNKQTNRHYENNGHLAVNQLSKTIENCRQLCLHRRRRPDKTVLSGRSRWCEMGLSYRPILAVRFSTHSV